MAITIDGQVYRNLQEQVKYLTDLTADIKPYIAGTGIIISGQTIAIDPSITDRITAVEGVAVTANNNAMTAQTTANAAQATANEASEVATSANSTANSAQTAAEDANTKALAAKTQAADALQTADSAQAAATQAQNRANSAYNLANTANTASQQNASKIQTIEDTAPQFSLEGTTLTITLPA